MENATIRKVRRTQTERTAETREALLDATIRLLHRNGYGGTPTELIAEEAGVSRGALRHHFPTRAKLMADVIKVVYEREHRAYQQMAASSDRGSRTADWPRMMWEVLSKPSGLAVLEILQSSRSDQGLAELVAPMQAEIERLSLSYVQERFGGGDEVQTLALMRLLVWAVRGLSIAQVLMPKPGDIDRSIEVLQQLIEGAVASSGGGQLKFGPASPKT